MISYAYYAMYHIQLYAYTHTMYECVYGCTCNIIVN